MNEIKDIVLREQEKLNSKIEKNTDVLTLISMLKIDGEDKILTKVKCMQVMINQCIQCGNYRRAFKFILITDKYLDKFINNKEYAVYKLTEIILRD